jgi:hypothetical protein
MVIPIQITGHFLHRRNLLDHLNHDQGERKGRLCQLFEVRPGSTFPVTV